MTATHFAAEIARNKSASFWLKSAVQSIATHDALDALREAEALLAFCKLRAIEAGLPVGINT